MMISIVRSLAWLLIITLYVQTITLRAQILEAPSPEDMIDLELVHPQLQVYNRVVLISTKMYRLSFCLTVQLNTFNAEPSGPWDGGDDIIMSIAFSHMASTAFKSQFNSQLIIMHTTIMV